MVKADCILRLTALVSALDISWELVNVGNPTTVMAGRSSTMCASLIGRAFSALTRVIRPVASRFLKSLPSPTPSKAILLFAMKLIVSTNDGFNCTSVCPPGNNSFRNGIINSTSGNLFTSTDQQPGIQNKVQSVRNSTTNHTSSK
ncbi:hypothetical protein GNI_040760 [Gregarina niphandrodes]|uniref:Transmembrane protein n=1 Tax=Gregarina niphandrodes TaxID=110365 RepID=A0A023BA94_GRENI|nr:hypothetical protein GNI_040760 [Gregarina niphandrodes]EZG78137.1 hypothetical protein GNI_040760 [Gregarina niphandrodes]|eukprot:XP_011129451.1 hypothetical protein GNI_040760 [Gregarina niphandrodes]